MNAVDITDALIKQLEKRGKHPRPEVKTAAGFADIVTDTAVYAVVEDLTTSALREAINEVTAHRQALGSSLRAIVVGQRSGEDISAELEEASQQDVSVQFWGEQA